MQASDSNGVVQVLTTFPSCYSGRALHLHPRAHVSEHLRAGSVVHIGQLFLAQSTLDTVNTMYPCIDNPNDVTPSIGKYLLRNSLQKPFSFYAHTPVVNTGIQQQANISYHDVFVETRSLGYNVSAGLVGFINIAIDPDTIPATAGRGGDLPWPAEE